MMNQSTVRTQSDGFSSRLDRIAGHSADEITKLVQLRKRHLIDHGARIIDSSLIVVPGRSPGAIAWILSEANGDMECTQSH